MYFFRRHEALINESGHIFRLMYGKQYIIDYSETTIHNKRLPFISQKTLFRFPIIIFFVENRNYSNL